MSFHTELFRVFLFLLLRLTRGKLGCCVGSISCTWGILNGKEGLAKTVSFVFSSPLVVSNLSSVWRLFVSEFGLLLQQIALEQGVTLAEELSLKLLQPLPYPFALRLRPGSTNRSCISERRGRSPKHQTPLFVRRELRLMTLAFYTRTHGASEVDCSVSEGTCLGGTVLLAWRVLGILGRRILAKDRFSCLSFRAKAVTTSLSAVAGLLGSLT